MMKARDAWDSMTTEDFHSKQKADDARDSFCHSEERLKKLLLTRYLENKGITSSPYSHTQEFWTNKTEVLDKVIKKLEKKMEK